MQSQRQLRTVILGGGIVPHYINGRVFLLLIVTSKDLLGFPKGHINKGESIIAAARREVTEETGLEVTAVYEELGVVYRGGREPDGEPVNKEVHLFLMEGDTFGDHHDEDYLWVELTEAAEKMYWPQERAFLTEHHAAIVQFAKEKSGS